MKSEDRKKMGIIYEEGFIKQAGMSDENMRAFEHIFGQLSQFLKNSPLANDPTIQDEAQILHDRIYDTLEHYERKHVDDHPPSQDLGNEEEDNPIRQAGHGYY